jgi:hypothetical protein
MSGDRLRDEMLYRAALSMLKTMKERDLITEEEFLRADADLTAEFDPYLGRLFTEKT